jgi:hypothetical protein
MPKTGQEQGRMLQEICLPLKCSMRFYGKGDCRKERSFSNWLLSKNRQKPENTLFNKADLQNTNID